MVEIETKEARIRRIAQFYYSKKEVQEAIVNFCKKRETVPQYFQGYGKRPDIYEYPAEIFNIAKKGATSFHCSEEIWNNPMEISTDFDEKQYNELRTGWDLLIDIDSPYLEYSKIAAQLILQALEFHHVTNVGIKFSGSKGFHLIVPWKSFPSELYDHKTSDQFPEWPRIISLYLTELIKPRLIEKVSQLTEDKSYVKDFEADQKVMPDIVLVSSRHLFRAPYSLHEKTSLASVVLNKEEIENFQPKDADPMKVQVKNFLPDVKEGEARDLLIQSLDWYKEQQRNKPKTYVDESGAKKQFKKIKVDKNKIQYPPAISQLLNGGIKDGRKRALFILMHYFNSLAIPIEEIDKKIQEWNKKNKPSLKEGYIKSQFSWMQRNKPILPPNYDKDFYKAIGITPTEEELKFKNPVNYTTIKYLQSQEKNEQKPPRKKSKS